MLKMMWMRIKVIAGVYGLIQWHLTNEMGTTCNLISMNKIDAWILKKLSVSAENSELKVDHRPPDAMISGSFMPHYSAQQAL
jgi:hypothetical protein